MTDRDDVAYAMERAARNIRIPKGFGPDDREAGVPPEGWPQPQVHLRLFESEGTRYYELVGIRGIFSRYPVPSTGLLPTHITIGWHPWCTLPKVDLRSQHQSEEEANKYLDHLHYRYGRPPDIEHYAVIKLIVINPDCFNAKVT